MRKLFAAFITAFICLPSFAEQAPAEAQACTACHGVKGVASSPVWPNLAGQNADYLALQITAFRDGGRSNPAMAPFVANLNDDAIQRLAKYYASLPAHTAADGDSELVAKGENLSGFCKACHGMDGHPVAPQWPNLAGQHAQYLASQLSAYKSGARVHPLMQAAVSQVAEEDFAALAAYYSQLEAK